MSSDVTLIIFLWRHHFLNNLNLLVSTYLVTLLGLFVNTDATFWNFIYLFVINLIIKNCIKSISTWLSSSFTICELTIVLQASFTFLAQSTLCFLTSFNLFNIPASCSPHEEAKVLQVFAACTFEPSQ